MRYTQRPLKWSYIQIYINKTYYDASWVRTTVATIIISMLVKILLFSSLEKSFSVVVTAGRRFPDLYPECSGLLVDTHLPSTQIYKFLPFSKIFGIFQLLKFPPKRLFVPDCRTAAAIRFRLSSTLPSRKPEGTMYDTTFRNKEPGTSCLQDSLLVSSSFICCSALWSILSDSWSLVLNLRTSSESANDWRKRYSKSTIFASRFCTSESSAFFVCSHFS